MKFIIYRYLVGVLSLVFFMSQIVYARPAIIPSELLLYLQI